MFMEFLEMCALIWQGQSGEVEVASDGGEKYFSCKKSLRVFSRSFNF